MSADLAALPVLLALAETALIGIRRTTVRVVSLEVRVAAHDAEPAARHRCRAHVAFLIHVPPPGATGFLAPGCSGSPRATTTEPERPVEPQPRTEVGHHPRAPRESSGTGQAPVRTCQNPPVGRLIPANFAVSALEPSERRTVEALVAGTGADWLVLPHVPFVERGIEGEADVVLLHPELGGVVLEVKGGRIAVRQGAWFQDDRPLAKSPVDQAARAMHTLVRKMKGAGSTAPRPHLVHAIVLPDAVSVPDESLGPDLEPTMVLTATELVWPEEALRHLMSGSKSPGNRIDLGPAVRALRPDLDFTARLADEIDGIERRLDDDTDATLRNLELSDTNTRLVVTGPAGSGKSRLALRWAERAVDRGERTALVCFNRPMGAVFTAAFADRPEVFAGTFHGVAGRLLAEIGHEQPAETDKAYWEQVLPALLIERRGELGPGFDTIIVDEYQDISEHWTDALEGLLDPDGAGRLLRLGDPNQNLYRTLPNDDALGLRMPLAVNCRNTKRIAEVALRLAGSDAGGEPTDRAPDGPPVRFRPARALREIRKRVRDEVHLLRVEHELPVSGIAIITTAARLRDEILEGGIDGVTIDRWDNRDEGIVVCETAHRLKGTEWQAVVVASLTETTKEWLPDVLYVGITRPRTWLSVVALPEIGELLGLAATEG